MRQPHDSTLCEGEAKKATRKLHELGQSVWLDNITRDLLTSGTLRRYISDLSLTGLTSNPTIFDHAIRNSSHYDSANRSKLTEGKSSEALFFELAIENQPRQRTCSARLVLIEAQVFHETSAAPTSRSLPPAKK